jgi:hypothetical protein
MTDSYVTPEEATEILRILPLRLLGLPKEDVEKALRRAKAYLEKQTRTNAA